MGISLIAAFDLARNIGLNNDMPWGKDMKGDLKRFKELTDGKTIIMGRKTFESLPGILYNRRHVIISRDETMKLIHPGSVFSLEEAIEIAKASEDEVFVIGGAQIYEEFLPHADKIYITKIHALFEGNVKFPSMQGAFDIEYGDKQLVDGDKYPSQYITYTRRG